MSVTEGGARHLACRRTRHLARPRLGCDCRRRPRRCPLWFYRSFLTFDDQLRVVDENVVLRRMDGRHRKLT